MSGLGPTLYQPWQSTATFLLAFTKPEDGSAIDLTGATGIKFLLKSSPTLDDADAEFILTVGSGLTVIDAVAGLVQATISAPLSAALVPWGPFYYETRATLLGGAVVIPDLLRGSYYNDLDSVLEQQTDGDSITRLDAADGTLTPVTPDMSNYVINRYDLTGLTGGTSVKLDGLSEATLDALSNGAGVRLFFTGSIMADFRLRANTGAETTSAPWKIVSTNDTTRVWQLLGVWKEGTPCLWVSSLSKFKQVLEASGAIALADDADAFVLP